MRSQRCPGGANPLARWCILIAVGALSSATACKKTKATTRPPVEGKAAEHEAPPALGDTSAAYEHADAPALEGKKKRERPKAEPVASRDDAIAAVRKGNPDGAADFLGKHVQDNAKDLDARLALARALLYLGRYDDANKTLADGAGAPTDVKVLLLRSHLHRVRGQYGEAIKLLEAQVRRQSKSLPLRGELLSLLVATGRKDDARARELMDSLYDAYEASTAKSARDMLAVAQAALARGSKGAFHDANMVLEEAEEAAPVKEGDWIADQILLTRGQMFREKYAQEEAVTTFGMILERDEWHPDAMVGTAQVHVDGLRFAAATRLAEEALQVNPSHPGAHAVLARVALIEGRRKEARRRVEEHSLKVDPTHVDGLAVVAGLAIFGGDTKAYAAARDRALAANPKNGRFFRELADILGFLHLYPESEQVLSEGAKIAPRDAYVNSARGLNLLRLGEEEKGRQHLMSAWKGDPFNARTKNVLDLYEERIDKAYTLKEQGSVKVRLPNDDREFVEPVLLESVAWSRTALDKAYATKAGSLRLEFFREHGDFSIRTVGVPSLGAVAVCFGPVITFIGPYAGVFNVENVIRHELAHVYAIKISKGRVPRWFTEGLSEWESEQANPAWARESAELLQRARRAGKLRRLHELELAFIRAESSAMMEVAYSTAAYAVRYLGTTYGRPKLVAILEGYATGQETDALFRKHLGKSLGTVEKEFEAWFFAELDKKVAGWHPSADETHSDERDAMFRKAVAALEAKDTAGAVRMLEELVNKGGDGFTPRMLLAQILFDGPNKKGARRHLEAARKFHKESIDPLVKLAELARSQGNVGDEKKLLAEALTIDGDSLEPAARLLLLSIATDDKRHRKIALRRVRGTAPLHPISLAGSALDHVATGKKKAAAPLVARAVKALGDSPGGPADTLAVVALAADAVGDTASAKRFADLARKDPKLPVPALKKLEKIK